MTKFLKYKAVRDIALGSTSTQISAGQIVEFDGEMLKLGSQTMSYPQVRSAIKQGWFEPYGKGHAAKEAQVEAPKTKKAFSKIENDQVEVGTVVKSIQKTKDASAPKTATKEATPAPKPKVAAVSVPKTSKFTVERENEDATPIGVLGSGGKVEWAVTPKPKCVIQQTEIKDYIESGSDVETEPDIDLDLSDVTPPSKAKKSKKASTPTIEWDKDRSPQVRIKDAITLYKNDPAALKQVCALEDKGVAAQIKEKLKKLQAKK